MVTISFHSEGQLIYHSVLTMSSGVPVVTEVGAGEYLSFARSDFSQGSTHGLINALGNAKRALHLMIDTLLQNYGMLRHNKVVNFPEKLELLDQAGLIAFNVFRRLNGLVKY